MKRIFIVFFSLVSIALPIYTYAHEEDQHDDHDDVEEVVICHKQDTDSEHPQTITIDEDALQAHLDHGDTEGACTGPEINHLPVFTGPATATTTVGANLTFSIGVSDEDGDTLVLDQSLPQGATFTDGNFSWTPTETGTSTASFFAFDGTGTSTKEVWLIVGPELTPLPEIIPDCSVNGLFGFYYNLPKNHPNIETEITGVIPGTTPFEYDWFGDQFLSFKRNDAIEAFNVPKDYFPVDEELEGDPFYFAVHWKGSITISEIGDYQTTLSSDDDAWLYINDVEKINLGGIHELTGTTTLLYLERGTFPVDIYFAERHVVQSGIVFSMDGGVTFSPCVPTITENHLPVFTGPATATTTVGANLTFSIGVSDEDGDTLVLDQSLPQGATFTDGNFSWAPTETGTSTASFSAFDGTGTSTKEVLITVDPASGNGGGGGGGQNGPPQFVDFHPPLEATSTEAYTYTVKATDPDSDPLSFSLLTKPDGMAIATTTGIISWTPADEQASSTPFGVTVQVSDGQHATSTSYSITVAKKVTDNDSTGGSPPPPSQSGGGGGGGVAANGPPFPLAPPIFSSSAQPPPSNQVVINTAPPANLVPSQSTPNIPPAKGPPDKLVPRTEGISFAPTSTAASEPYRPSAGRRLAALLFAGTNNLLDWLGAHGLLGWLLLLLTLITFLIYFLARKSEEEIEAPVIEGSMPLARDVDEEFNQAPADEHEYWETYPSFGETEPQEKE